MFKYEEQIADFNRRYNEVFDNLRGIFDRPHASTEFSVPHRFDGNTVTACNKYYTFIEGTGYVRTTAIIAEKKVHFGVDRSDRDLFERNNIDYPGKGGLYLIGQTFFNPITDEKFYWVKVGEAINLKRRRHDYNTPTAMIWDVGFYLEDDLTEYRCHEKLRAICTHRHADEWFAVPREDYLKICDEGFEWFKEA